MNAKEARARIARENAYMIDEASLCGFHMPDVIDAFPETFKRDQTAIVDAPCPSCGSVLVNTSDRAGRPRNPAQVDLRDTGSSLRLESHDPVTPTAINRQHSQTTFVIECKSGACGYVMGGRAFLTSCLAATDPNTFHERASRLLPRECLPKNQSFYFVHTGEDTYFSIGSEHSAMDQARLGAGCEVSVQVTNGIDLASARLALKPDAWQQLITTSSAQLPIGWHGGKLTSDEQYRQGLLDSEKERALERALDEQVSQYRNTLKASSRLK